MAALAGGFTKILSINEQLFLSNLVGSVICGRKSASHMPSKKCVAASSLFTFSKFILKSAAMIEYESSRLSSVRHGEVCVCDHL